MRAAATPVRRELVEPLRRVLGWMLSLRDAEGAIVCPFHRIEHTGKSAGAAVLACSLARLDPDANQDELLGVARQQARRLVSRLEREGESTCFTFRPGRHDPYNCSNSVIDGGACSDALAEVVQVFGDRLDPKEREAFARASVLGAQTYLRYCVLDKGIPAQKAWALTGVAQAHSLSGHEVLELTVREGARILDGLTRPDGSVPYHPLELGAGHPGASDVSAFYQSRVTGFLAFALERAGLDPASGPWRGQLDRGLDFLVGLVGPDGIKPGLVEAKPWYWGATYEVASHPFDLYALAVGSERLGRTDCEAPLRASWRAWAAHLGPDGAPRSHLPGSGRSPSYQCPLFWAGHASWAARALPALDRAWDRPAPQVEEPRVRLFRDAQLARLDGGGVTAWVRGARPPGNLYHGSPAGAGLVRVVGAWRDDAQCEGEGGPEELLERCRLGAHQDGEWTARVGPPSALRGLRANGSEARFTTWLARNAYRGRGLSASLGPLAAYGLRGLAAFAGPRVSTAFDRAASLEPIEGGVRVRARASWRDGKRSALPEVVRTFTASDAGLRVEEEACGAPGSLRYAVPRRAIQVGQTPQRVSWTLAGAQRP
jgi:hypothetical protein